MSGRTPPHRRPAPPSNEIRTLRDMHTHLTWRLNAATNRDAPAIAARLALLTKELEAARRRDARAAEESRQRRTREATARLAGRLRRILRAELRAEGEPCDDDLLNDMAQEMIDRGEAHIFLAEARAAARSAPVGDAASGESLALP